jgi:hypothetical protein
MTATSHSVYISMHVHSSSVCFLGLARFGVAEGADAGASGHNGAGVLSGVKRTPNGGGLVTYEPFFRPRELKQG